MDHGSIHSNHRQRMRERVIKDGYENFALHEILEVLLYYSIPRGDTNELAHRLLDRFGSFHGITDASVDELTSVDGIGEQSAVFLKMIPELLKRYAYELDDHSYIFNSLSKVGRYISRRFIGLDHERLYMMMFNNRMNLIDCVVVSEGSVNASDVPLRIINEKLVTKKASCFILAHNHPNGVSVPSDSDKNFTEVIRSVFDNFNAPLIEHLVIAGYNYYPILRHMIGEFCMETSDGRFGSGFYKEFYDVDDEHCVVTDLTTYF